MHGLSVMRGIRGGKFFWSYNIGQLHLGKQIYIGKYLLIKRKVTRNFSNLGRMEVGDWYYAVCLKKKILNGVYGSLDNVKVFELTILLSSAINMVTQIIYLGRIEVGDWYYADCFKINIFLVGFTAVWT